MLIAHHAVALVTRLGRLFRALRPDRNPLRRGTDRAESAIGACLIGVFAIGAPIAALTAGHSVYHASIATQRHQATSLHRVPAVLLENTPLAWVDGLGAMFGARVRARWTAPDRSPRTGRISAPGGIRAGSIVMVWADGTGRLSGPPLTRSEVVGQTVLAAILAPMALAFLLMLAWALARRALDRRRMAAWEADWSSTGPRWTRQG